MSLFSHGSREGFMAVYHPPTRSGVVHYSPPEDLPAKKFWSWGSDPDGLDWRKALSDDESAYVEVQAGLFRNQETYAFLEPQETIAFSEDRLPLRDLGGLVRATRDAALNLTRTAGERGPDHARGGVLRDAADVAWPAARARRQPDTHRRSRFRPTPRWSCVENSPACPQRAHYTFELQDASGTLVRHTEDKYDFIPSTDIRLGPQPSSQLPPPAQASEVQIVEIGTRAELDGRLLEAYRVYAAGLERFPDAFELHKAIGRLALQLKRPDEAVQHLTAAAARVSNDPEIEYYTGLALQLLGDDRRARAAFRTCGAPCRFPCSRAARARAPGRACREPARGSRAARHSHPRVAGVGACRNRACRLTSSSGPIGCRASRAAAMAGDRSDEQRPSLRGGPSWARGCRSLAASCRRPRPIDRARRRLPGARLLCRRRGTARAPAAIRSGGGDRTRHARRLRQPAGDVLPGLHRLRAGLPADGDFHDAAGKPTTYIFPNRPETLAVLRAALQRDPTDATASFLLGSLYLSGGRVEPALEAWTAARRQNPRIPGLHRNLGLTYMIALDRPDQALEIFREGLDVDPQNIGLYVGIDQALSLTGGTASERASALARYPDAANMPAAVSFKLALALAEAGRFDEADRIFVNRFFASEELGTNVRDVYLEVRLMRARDAARHQQCGDALAVIDRLADPVDGIPFTRDGLDAFLQSARRQQQIGEVEAACGRADRARDRWRGLDGSTTLPALDLAFAYRAARDVCQASDNACLAAVDQAWRPRLAQSLAAVTRQIEAAGTGASGTIRCAQGLLLAALGRADEAKASFRAALLTPDRALSHHLARRGWGNDFLPLHLFRVGSTTSSDASGSPAAGPCQTLPPNVVM